MVLGFSAMVIPSEAIPYIPPLCRLTHLHVTSSLQLHHDCKQARHVFPPDYLWSLHENAPSRDSPHDRRARHHHDQAIKWKECGQASDLRPQGQEDREHRNKIPEGGTTCASFGFKPCFFGRGGCLSKKPAPSIPVESGFLLRECDVPIELQAWRLAAPRL